MANSSPVVIASNQSTLNTTTIDVTTSGNITTQNLNPNSGVATAGSTVSLSSLTGRATLTIQVTGTYTGALTVQATVDGSNWISVNSVQNIGTGFVSTTIASGVQSIFQTDASGFLAMRVSANAAVTGTATITLEAASTPTLVSLDNSVGQQAAANSLSVALPNEQVQDLYIAGQSAQTATINNIIPSTASSAATDATGYRSASIQVVSTGTAGTFIFEGSNDNVNFQSIVVYNQVILTGTPIAASITASATSIIYTFPIQARYIRLRIATTITGGSIQAFTRLSQTPFSPSVFQASQATAANLNATVSATNLSTNIAQIGGTTTVNGGVAGILSVGGNVAHSAASTANPLQMAGRVVPTTIATTDVSLVAGDVSYKPITTGLQAITKNFSTSELDYLVNATFNLTTATGATPSTLVSASGTALVRNYITQITVQGDALGAAGTIAILDYAIAGTSVTIATPGVFTTPAHGFIVGDAIMFSSIGTITGITINTIYYITSTSFTTTTFTIATTTNGTAIQITGVTSAFTVYKVMTQIRLQTAAIATPYVIDFSNPLRGSSNIGTLIAYPSLTSGSIYLTVNGYRGF